MLRDVCFAEEERKRLQQTGNEFQYSYDGAEAKTEGPEPNEVLPGAEEEPFVAPPSLDVPADIVTVGGNFRCVRAIELRISSPKR